MNYFREAVFTIVTLIVILGTYFIASAHAEDAVCTGPGSLVEWQAMVAKDKGVETVINKPEELRQINEFLSQGGAKLEAKTTEVRFVIFTINGQILVLASENDGKCVLAMGRISPGMLTAILRALKESRGSGA